MSTPVDLPRPDADQVPTDDAVRAELTWALTAHQKQLDEAYSVVESLEGDNGYDSITERELAEQAIQRSLGAIAEIQAALERLALGTYATCERCGEAIAPARLAAIPHARYCVDCPAGGSTLLW